MNKFVARFFDGKIINPTQATVELKADGVEIISRHQSAPVVFFWPAASLQILALPHHGRPGIVGCVQNPSARLVISDEIPFKAILALAPKRHIQHAGLHQPWRVVLGLSIFFVAIFVAMLWGIQLAAPTIARAMPEKWEDNLGKWSIKGLAGDRLECVAPEGRQALEKITLRLTKAAKQSPSFDVRVLQWGEVNAFAAPGPHLVIMSDLLQLTDSPEEVAGILAHEMGHVIERHPTQSVIRQLSFKILITAALGSTYDFASNLLILKYSRKDEIQADEIGRQLLADSHIDSQGMINFFKKMTKIEGESILPEDWSNYLSSHPNTEERIKAFQANSAKVKLQPLLTEKEWQALKNICRETKPLKFDDHQIKKAT